MDSELDLLRPYIPPCLFPLTATLQPHAPWLLVAFLSLSAIYLGYNFLSSAREAPVPFNVPIPPELRQNWTGKKWEDVQGEEKKVLEGQVQGVSPTYPYPRGKRTASDFVRVCVSIRNGVIL